MPTVDEVIQRAKYEKAYTDRGLPPYAHPEHVAALDARRATIQRLQREGRPMSEILDALRMEAKHAH